MNLRGFLNDARDCWRHNDDGENFLEYTVACGEVTHLVDDFDDEGFMTPAGIERAQAFVARAQNWTPTAWYLYHRWQRVKSIWTFAVCTVMDHDLVDDSYGGPDSGAMGAHCRRCGWSWHHQLY